MFPLALLIEVASFLDFNKKFVGLLSWLIQSFIFSFKITLKQNS